MRAKTRIGCAAIAILLLLVSQIPAAELHDQSGYYIGTIGSQRVVMTLSQDGGSYRYLRYGPPIWLNPDAASNQDIHLIETGGENSSKTVARLRAQLDSHNHYQGTWTSIDGQRSLPLNLERIADLASFKHEEPRISVERYIPHFTGDTPFYLGVTAIARQHNPLFQRALS